MSLRAQVDDLNFDGVPDVVFTCEFENNMVYLGGDFQSDYDTETLAFTGGLTALESTDEQTTSVAVADVDGDGNPDLVFSNYEAPNYVLFGDGTGAFDVKVPVGEDTTTTTTAVKVADLDGDGSMELVFANEGQDNHVFKGMGTDTRSTLPTAVPTTIGLPESDWEYARIGADWECAAPQIASCSPTSCLPSG